VDLRTAAFLDCANYPSMEFTSTGITAEDTRFTLAGDLAIRGVTRRVAVEGNSSGSARQVLTASRGPGSPAVRRCAGLISA